MTENEKQSAEDVILSLTGFDEIAIEKAFRSDLEKLTAQRQMRALAFVIFKRQGQPDPDAYEAAMTLSQRDVLDMFGIAVDEVMPDEPVSDLGKDGSPPESERTGSLPSLY